MSSVISESTVPVESRRRFRIRLLLWNCLTLPVVGLIYWVINAEGVRLQIPIFALRLHKLPIPGFSYLKDYEGLYRLDLAHVFAMFLLFAVWHLWIVVVRLLLYGQLNRSDDVQNVSRFLTFVLTLAAIIIGGDAILFYFGLSARVDSLWSTSSGLTPLFATIVYTAVLAFVALVHVQLEHD